MNYYEAWGYPVYEREMEDDYNEVNYTVKYVNVRADFKWDIIDGDWYPDFDYESHWEDYMDNDDYWYGDYDERVIDKEIVWETIAEAVFKELGDIEDGSYFMTADVDFSVDVNGLWVGKLPENEDEIIDDEIESEIIDVKIKNIEIERLD